MPVHVLQRRRAALVRLSVHIELLADEGVVLLSEWRQSCRRWRRGNVKARVVSSRGNVSVSQPKRTKPRTRQWSCECSYLVTFFEAVPQRERGFYAVADAWRAFVRVQQYCNASGGATSSCLRTVSKRRARADQAPP